MLFASCHVFFQLAAVGKGKMETTVNVGLILIYLSFNALDKFYEKRLINNKVVKIFYSKVRRGGGEMVF